MFKILWQRLPDWLTIGKADARLAWEGKMKSMYDMCGEDWVTTATSNSTSHSSHNVLLRMDNLKWACLV